MFSQAALEHLADFRLARVTIPLREGRPVSLEGVLRLAEIPFLEARFLAGRLPLERIDPDIPWTITSPLGTTILCLQARFAGIRGERGVRLETLGVSSNDDPRRHFRVDAPVALARRAPLPSGGVGEPIDAGDVNLSVTGLRFTTSASLKCGERLALEIHFPGETGWGVRCEGEVVRISGNGEGRREAALRFVELEAGALEGIRLFCLAEKFRSVPDRVALLGDLLRPDGV